MKFYRDIFNLTQLKRFICDMGLLMFTAIKTSFYYLADLGYASCGKLSPRAVVSNKELVGVVSIWEFGKKYFLVFYYTFLAAFAIDYVYPTFFILCALIIELVILYVGCFWRDVWMFRVVVLGFIRGVWDIQQMGTTPGGYQDYAELSALTVLSKVTFTSMEWWVSLYESLTILVVVITYYFYYFLAVYLPYFCFGLILFAPLAAALSLFLFGYLIGYHLAGRLSVFLILISALSSCYIWFIFPSFRKHLVAEYGRGWGLFVLEPRHDFATSGFINVFPTHQIEQELIQPLKDVAFLSVKNAQHLNLWLDFGPFISAPFFTANFEFVIDSISIVMVTTITVISFLVHLFATTYMKSDPHQVRFFALLSLFTFFMIVLVLGGNMVMLYIGWEGVGLSSFLLISFWYTRVAAQKAAVKAMLVNKIGDMFLVLAIAFITYFAKGSCNIITAPIMVVDSAQNSYFFAGFTAIDVIALSLGVAACVKSAQIFFHTWLADAMEGPTPVSALLHAATMVTAGVYLIVRFSYIFECSGPAKMLIFFAGLLTILMSSMIAAAQYDIKKIIAFSTCSQLGVMFLACGMSAYDLALYHFFNHAFFKCLLFLLAGAIIHQLRNEQDIRKMGGLAKKMPFTFLCFTIASLSLAGMPGFSGALSKDAILHLNNYVAGSSENIGTSIALFSLNFIIYLTMIYNARLIYYVFLGPANYNPRYFTPGYRDVSLQERTYTFTFCFLALMSIFGGGLFKSYFFPQAFSYVDIFSRIVILNPLHSEIAGDSFFSYIAFFFTVHGLCLTVYLLHFFITNKFSGFFLYRNKTFYTIFCFFNKKCYFDDVYNVFLIRPILRLSYIFNFAIERGIFGYLSHLLWRAITLPLYSRSTFVRFSMVDHFVLTSSALILLLIFTYIMGLK